MTDYCDLDPHVHLSEAAEYTGIGVKTIQKYVSVEKLIQPFESPEKEGGWYLFGRMDFTRLLIIKKLIENGMLIKDVKKFMVWLDGSLVNLRRHSQKQRHLQEHTDNPNQFKVDFETGFGREHDWRGGDPALENDYPYKPSTFMLILDKLSQGRVLNYDPFPTQKLKLEFYNGEAGYPKPPSEASGWLQYWKSVQQNVYVDQYRMMEEHPEYPSHQLLFPVRSVESQSKAAKYIRRWVNRIEGEIFFNNRMYQTSSAVSNNRVLDLAEIKAEIAGRILNPPEAIKQRYRGSS